MTKPDQMTDADKSLLTGPYQTLTPTLLQQIDKGIAEHERRYNEDFPQLVMNCPYETRLAVACWTMKHLYQHAREGGTYRWLIYHRLAFGPDSYAPVMFAHGMDISNEFVVTELSEDDEKLLEAIHKAIALLPADAPVRDTLYEVMRRFESLAGHAERSVAVINVQRSEIESLVRAGKAAEGVEKP